MAGAADSSPKERYIQHAAGRSGGGSYIDSVILRDRDQTNGNNGSADGTLERRLYFAQNWRADVSVTMTDTGRILEWIKYSAYGVVQRVPMADFNRDGFVDFFDDIAYDDCYTGVSCPAGQSADINFDGFLDFFDYDDWDLTYPEQGATNRGVLAENDASAATNRVGYAGYFFEPSTQQYLVRNRELDPNTGIWDERDPMGYHDGADLYMYVKDSPIGGRDPMGLRTGLAIDSGGDTSSPLSPIIPAIRRLFEYWPCWAQDYDACMSCCERFRGLGPYGDVGFNIDLPPWFIPP